MNAQVEVVDTRIGEWPAYVRGLAHLQMGEGEMAAAEFRKLLDHAGTVG